MSATIDILRSVCVVAAAAACNPQPAPVAVVAEAPPTPTTTAAPAPAPEQPRDVAPPWRATPPFARGPVFAMTRHDDLVTATKDDTEFTLGPVALGDCVDGIPESTAPAAMPAGTANESPVWVQLQGTEAAASLALTTRRALLFVDNGCLRFADVTASMFGLAAGFDDEDALFGPSLLAPDDASQSDRFSFAAGTVTRDGQPLLRVEPLLDETLYEALDYDGATYLRVGTMTEDDDTRARQVTYDFRIANDTSPPELQLFHDLHYAGEDDDRGEIRIQMTRASGAWQVTATRVSVFDALNIGAGRCPEMEGALAYRATTDEARWRVGTHDLGTARADVLWASGCVEEAQREAQRRRGKVVGKSAREIRWTALDE